MSAHGERGGLTDIACEAESNGDIEGVTLDAPSESFRCLGRFGIRKLLVVDGGLESCTSENSSRTMKLSPLSVN